MTLLTFALIGPTPIKAYRQPISNQFMTPFCPLKADGSKDNNCLFIPKAECSYFVSKQGSDNNPGTEASPFGTIQKGVDVLTAGKKLCIKGYSDGTKYPGSVSLTNKNGNNNAWITIGGYEPDKRVVIQGTNYSNGTITITNSSFIRVMGIEVTKSNNGFTAQVSNNIDFINLKAYDNWNWGIGVPSNSGPSQRIRMEHSDIYDNVKKNVIDPTWNPNLDREGQGGTGAQFNLVAEGAYRYNKLYRNFGEGLDVHKDANQVIVEDNLFSENSHTSFYVNHASNILFHRNLVICSGEKPSWHSEYDRRDDNLGTAITFRQERGHNSDDLGGNNAAINNIVMGCTVHFVATTQTSQRPSQSLIVANNTFIDARKKEGNDAKAAKFVQLQSDAGDYGESVLFLNNLFKFVDTRASLTSSGAVALNKIIFANNMTDSNPGFTEGITKVNSLPFLGNYDHTAFLGDKTKPWELSTAQLNNIKRWAMLANNSPAVNSGSVTMPNSVPTSDKSRFENLYRDYLNQDYFGNVRGDNPDVGAHESDGIEQAPLDETVLCVSKKAEFADNGPIKDSQVTYKLRFDWPEGPNGTIKIKDYYSDDTEIVEKPAYCLEKSEQVLGASSIRVKGIPEIVVGLVLLFMILLVIGNSKLSYRKKLALITGLITLGLGIILTAKVIEKELSPDDSEAQIIKFLECEVTSNLPEMIYKAKLIGDQGDTVSNTAKVYENNEEVSSCFEEFVIQAEGAATPSVGVSNSPTISRTPTPPPSVTDTPPPSGNICGKADTDGNGRFTIADFAQFAQMYGMGKNICADKDVDYGPCGGRDVNKDGKLNIADFGGAGIGFAQRYYPKTSCAL